MKAKFNLNDLSTWPVFLNLLVSIIIIMFILFIGNKLFVSDKKLQIKSTMSSIQKEKKVLKDAYADVANLEGIRKEANELKAALTEILKFLPNEISMPSLIDSVYQKARDNGIVFQNFTPGKDINNLYYITKPISLEADVGFLSMTSFIESVTALDRIMNVESVSFKAEKVSGINSSKDSRNIYDVQNRPLEMKAELRTYIFKDDAKTGDK